MKKVKLIDSLFLNKEPNRHLGLISINNILNKNGFTSTIINFDYSFFRKNNINNRDILSMANYILKDKPDFVGLSTLCETFHITLELAKQIKRLSKNTIVFLGGPHSSLTYNYILKTYTFIDFIMVGESENTIINILKNCGNFNENIEGVAFLENDKVFYKKTLKNFEFDSLQVQKKLESQNIKTISLEGGRGCPFNCSFCCTKINWNREFRLKPSYLIVEEMEFYYRNFNIKEFNIEHDLFIYSKKLFFEFCDLLMKKGLNKKVSWSCSSRIDLLDEEIIKKLSVAGCSKIFLGIESISKDIQKKINKNLSIDKIFSNLELLYKYNIVIFISLIYGFPFETFDDFKKNIEFSYYVYNKYNAKVSLNKLRYYPESELTKKYFNELKFDVSFYKNSIFKNDNIEQQIMEHKLIFSEFYTITTEITNSFYSFDIYHNIVILFLKTFFKKTYNNLFQSGEEYYQNYILFVPYIHEIENLKRNFISSSIFELIIEFSEVFR